MNKKVILIIVVAAIVILILFNKRKEGYGAVLGAAAEYQEQLVNCLNQCEREDPSNRLYTGDNINCATYCDFIITEMSKNGVPASQIKVDDSLTKCNYQCDTSGSTEQERRVCKRVCFSQNEVAKYCKELWCPYSNMEENECMRVCTSVQGANMNQGSWTWKRG